MQTLSTKKAPALSPAGPDSARGAPVREAKARIARNVLSNWMGLGANIVIGFLMAPFVVHRLGDTAYGIWALVLQLTGYMGVFDVGVRSALVRFVGRFHAEGDRCSMDRLVSLALLVFGILGIACMAGAGVIAAFVLPHMHIPPAMVSEARLVLILAAATMASGFALGMFQAVLAGLSRWDILNGIGIASLLLRTLLIIVFLARGHGLVALAVIQFLTSTLGYACAAAWAARLLGGLRLSLGLRGNSLLKPVFVHSAYAFLISVGNRINYEMDTIVIAAFLPVEVVTSYVIGFRLPQYVLNLVNSSAQVMSPLASGLDAGGRTEEVGPLLIRGTKYTLLLVYLINAAFLLLGRDLIRYWMGERYVASSAPVLIILTCGLFVSSTQSMGSHMLYGLGKHAVNVWCTLLEGVLNLGISLALVSRFGIYGVAAGTTLAATVVRGWFFPRGFLRALGVHPGEYVRHAVLPAVPPAFSFAAGFLALRRLIGGHGIAALGLASGAGLALYLACAWRFAFDERERDRLRHGLASWAWEKGSAPLDDATELPTFEKGRWES